MPWSLEKTEKGYVLTENGQRVRLLAVKGDGLYDALASLLPELVEIDFIDKASVESLGYKEEALLQKLACVQGRVRGVCHARLKRMRETLYAQTLHTCAADQDGWCEHPGCPQLRDNEPHATGRSCPLYGTEDRGQ